MEESQESQKSSGSPNPQHTEEDREQSTEDNLSDLFVVDCQPGENSKCKNIPYYEKKFEEVLQVKPENATPPKPTRPKAPQNTCWNCNGDHSLRDCKEPKNYDTINRNRMIFQSKGPRFVKTSRYHLDDAQKYPHIQAGQISKRLKWALGLQSNQIPRHIYRMRCLGYPPGWVEEAKVSHSGLSLFNSEGEEVADPGFEDGEVVAQGAKDKFDIKKIIEYPGFNCPAGPDVIDEYDRLNSKPMVEKDSIKFMKTMWHSKAVKAYKRKKMNTSGNGTPSNTTSKKRSLLLLDDMELDSDDGAASEEDGEVNDCQEENVEDMQSQATPSQGRKRSGSPTSSDCKKQKLEECDNESATSSTPCENQTMPSTSEGNNSILLSSPSLGQVTSVSLGTPIIVTSPYTSLPSADKFAKNICDVIYFENLPDSTGKYKTMSGLIKKVRSFVSKLNDEDEDQDRD